ncbi:putative cell wall-binding protein [Methanococcus maripaludis]|uniref:Putative cell wall-binding protein n=1 Tax=Methanococcus maripaludis TaxID=39152 RepID=A0A7J9NTA3_METMI|nr:cell wall-binding protein [Methanococcus maripaludis]MBA2850898.1 putative cell wall-binding protein [Methanococcus maripaludis]
MDIFKKLVLLMIVLMPVSYASDVILVSDNFADKLVAQTIADELDEFVLVESPWGNFSNDTLNEILNESPEDVVIIGGTVAVPENYTTALENENITVERINGSDRFDTNNLTINRFKDLFVNKTILIVYANSTNDTYGNITNVTFVLTDGNKTSVSEEVMENISDNITVLEDAAYNYSGLLNRLQNHGFQVSTASMPGNVLKAKIERRMNTIQTTLKALEQNGINISELDTKYGALTDAYEGGNYSYAYALAIQLEDDLKAKQYKTTGNTKVEKTVKVKTNNGKPSDDDSDDDEEIEYENETEDENEDDDEEENNETSE